MWRGSIQRITLGAEIDDMVNKQIEITHNVINNHTKISTTSLGGLEPPTFRLTAERANRLRHRDIHTCTKLGHQVIFFHLSANLQLKCHYSQNWIMVLNKIKTWTLHCFYFHSDIQKKNPNPNINNKPNYQETKKFKQNVDYLNIYMYICTWVLSDIHVSSILTNEIYKWKSHVVYLYVKSETHLYHNLYRLGNGDLMFKNLKFWYVF